MKQLIIMSLEPLENRYTKCWFTHLPKVFQEKLGEEFEVIQLDGETKSGKVTEGAFLDFEATNIWKAEQTIKFFQMMKLGRISDDAIILFTDAWNPCVNQIKYTKELCKKNWKLIGMWHAGAYDRWDFLGRIENIVWAWDSECSFYQAYDVNWFATEFHRNLFHSTLGYNASNKSYVAGFPMEYIQDIEFPNVPKEDLIVFPARMAPEKQPEIVKELEKRMPEFKFIFCCEENMSKKQYYETLAKAKLMISVSLQETYGICPLESLAMKTIPICPDRLSYSEMYKDIPNILYPSELSKDYVSCDFKELMFLIDKTIKDYKKIITDDFMINVNKMFNKFIKCDTMCSLIKKL